MITHYATEHYLSPHYNFRKENAEKDIVAYTLSILTHSTLSCQGTKYSINIEGDSKVGCREKQKKFPKE